MTIAETAFDDLPAALVAELEEAGLDPRTVYAIVVTALEEELPGGGEDVTSAAAVPAVARGTADLVARGPGVVCGLGISELVFRYVLGADVSVTGRVPDGSRVQAGDVVLTVAGPVRGLLTAERTALNFAGHLSGVATGTAAWVSALAGTCAQVPDTRKTLPGWRPLQKYAGRCGGGRNHRHSLAELALVKHNHAVAAGGAVAAFRAVRERRPDLPVEVEATTLEEVRAVREASGGPTVERASTVAATGVDLVSVGALTHSVDALGLGLDLRAAAP